MNLPYDYDEGVTFTVTPKPAAKFSPTKKTHADYQCMVGDKLRNTLLANAGLGVTGEFRPVYYTVDWQLGEKVDIDRARKLESCIMRGFNDSDERTVCNSVKLIRIYQQP